MVGDHGRETVVGPSELFLDHAFSREVEADAAVLLGNGDAEEPKLARLGHEIVGDRVVLLDPARARFDFLLDEPANLVSQGEDFGGEFHGGNGN